MDNINEGAFYLQKAADLGDVSAMLEYGRLLTIINEEDYHEEARTYLNRASLLGNKEARKLYNELTNKYANSSNNRNVQSQAKNNKNLSNQISNVSLINDDDLSISSEEVNQLDRQTQTKVSTPKCKKCKLTIQGALGIIGLIAVIAFVLIMYFLLRWIIAMKNR